jgi:hypothetical protein
MTLELDPTTGLLPPGEHPASMEELEAAFCWNYRRRQYFKNLELIVGKLKERSVSRIWVDGSFVTSEDRPGDIDVIFDPEGRSTASWGILHHLRRRELKRQFHIDLMPYPSPQKDPNNPFASKTILEYFKTGRDGSEKGVVILHD